MVTDKQPPNPYAAPVFPEPTAETFEFHQSYDLVDSKLLSRNGLWLPQYCLVTGSSDDVMPIQLSIIAASHATKRCRSAGVGCFLFAALAGGMAFSLVNSGTIPGAPLVVALTLSVPLLLITGLVLFLLGGRNRKSFTLLGTLQKRRQTLRTRLGLAPLIGMLVSSFLRFSGLVKGDLTWIVLLVSPWIATALLGRFFLLRGLQLQAVYLDDQLFEVRGFSRAFLEQLKRHSDEH